MGIKCTCELADQQGESVKQPLAQNEQCGPLIGGMYRTIIAQIFMLRFSLKRVKNVSEFFAKGVNPPA